MSHIVIVMIAITAVLDKFTEGYIKQLYLDESHKCMRAFKLLIHLIATRRV